jgi:hypothetical protein
MDQLPAAKWIPSRSTSYWAVPNAHLRAGQNGRSGAAKNRTTFETLIAQLPTEGPFFPKISVQKTVIVRRNLRDAESCSLLR